MTTECICDKRHIALYLPSLRGGGAERVMVMLANGFAERGHRVDLVLTRAEGPYLPEVAKQVRIVDLDKDRVLAGLLPLARYLRREQPDAMLSALNHANIIAILARKLARVPTRLVVSEHSNPTLSLAGGGIRHIMRRLIQHYYPQADAVVCVSQGIREEMINQLRLAPKILHPIYNPLDINRIHHMMYEPVEHPWFSKHDVPVVLAVGRLTPAKDYPNLLRAMKLLLQHLSVRLVILGHGEEAEALKHLTAELGIADCVSFIGFQRNPYNWMYACDLYVMSSAWEGLPGALMEALACGAKIVSTDCLTGPAEILEHGKWGRIVPVGDAAALAKAMAMALDDPTSLHSQKRAADFKVEISVHHYLSILLPGEAKVAS